MKKLSQICLIIGLLFFLQSHGQNKTKSKTNNAIVYIGSLEKKPTIIQYFHNEKLIGYCERKQYIKYECKPGKQLFWSKIFPIDHKSSRVAGFIVLDLKPNKTYYLDTKTFTTDGKNIMGSFKKGRKNLVQKLTELKDENSIKKFKTLIERKKPTTIRERKLEKYNEEFYEQITSFLYEYYRDNDKICN